MLESFATVWEALADAIPDADALVQGDRRVQWRTLEHTATQLAGGLTDLAVQRDSHVAMYLHNSPEFAATVFAAMKLRALPTSVNFRYAATELTQLLDDADAEVLVYHRALSAHVAAARPSLPALRVLVEVDDGSEEAHIPDALAFDDLVAGATPAPRIERAGADCLLWYTGGTTGLPKGVLWEQSTLLRFAFGYATPLYGDPPISVAAAAAAAQERTAHGPHPVTLLTTPMSHAATAFQLHLGLTLGGTVVMLPRGRVDGDDVCRIIERERVTLLSVVGDAVLRRVVDAIERADARGDPYDLSSLRRIHSSGAMARVHSKDVMHAHAPDLTFYDSLGASEAVGYGIALTTGVGQASSARFQLGPRARVLDPDDHDVVPGSGEAGVLAVTDSTGVAYYNDEARTARTFRNFDGVRYAVIGDWAVPHADGTFTLLGRGSGCINTGGEKVWPEEVEEALKTHPAVVDAVVVGVPDDEWGEAVAAVVALNRAAHTSVDELGDWVVARLARYKRPRRIVFTDKVVRTSVGKPDYPWALAQVTS